MKGSFTIIIILLFSKLSLFCDENYPVSYLFKDLIEGGKLIVSENKDDSSKCFFIKPSWLGETETISIWNGIEKRNVKGITLKDTKIFSSFIINNGLLLIWEENQKFYISLMDTDANIKSVTEIYNFKRSYTGNKINWINNGKTNEVLLLMNDNLYICKVISQQIQLTYVANKVKAAAAFKHNKRYDFAYISDLGVWTEVYFVEHGGKENLSVRLQLSSEISIFPIGKQIGTISSNKYANSSWLHIIEPEKGVIKKRLINANGKLINILKSGNLPLLTYLSYFEGMYTLNISLIKKGNLLSNQSIELTAELIEAKTINLIDDNLYLLFRNGLAVYNIKDGLQSIDLYPIGEYFEDIPDIMQLKNYIVLSSFSTTLIFSKKLNDFWWLNRFLNNTGKIILPALLIILLIFIYRKYRRQKRLLNAVLELPSSGVVFVIDKKSRLRSANDSGKKMLKISDNVPMKRLFQYYCEPERTKSLKELVDKVINLRKAFTQKIDIIEGTAVKEWYFSIVLLTGFTGKFKGCVLTGIDITEQLERKRLTNWAQLAHDMQTNLSTIRLNAEQLDYLENETNLNRRQKILHQVGLLIHKIRDIVTVGRTANPELQNINAADICFEARSEFDEIMFPFVKFELNLKEFYLYCDKAKMIRALRNVIENAIRSLKEQEGTIIISNWYDNKFSYFSVKDTGIGMNQEQMENILTPYFSTSQKEGGAGIGTMIIQNVVEQHSGNLKIESEPGKGTEVILSIPIINLK